MSQTDSHVPLQTPEPRHRNAVDGFQGLGNYVFRVAPDLGFSFRQPPPINGLTPLGQAVEIQEYTGHSLRPSKTRLGAITTSEARKVIECVAAVNPQVAAGLRLREESLADMPFRLCKLRGFGAAEESAVFGEDETYIALSYCCSLSPVISRDTPTDTPMVSLPISDFMFNAVLSELKSSHEGIWIDTLSIHQANEEEKRRVIGLMDVIYKNARLVVIVLEDLVITEDEYDLLDFFINLAERGEVWDMKRKGNAALHASRFVWKLFSARWFTRAWCNHEFRLSRNHVFLARVDFGPSIQCKVLRFTANFLSNIMEVDASYSTYKHPTDELYWTLRNPVKGRAAAFHRQSSLIDPSYKMPPSITDPITSFMDIFVEVFALDATLAQDKLAISLNVADCGLSFEGLVQSTDECRLILSLVALAARDPTVLCSSGRTLDIPGQEHIGTWLRLPVSGDVSGPFGNTVIHRRLEHVPPFTQETVTLDLLLLGDQSVLHHAREPFITQAAWFVDGSFETASQKGYWLDRNWQPGFPVDEFKRQYFIEALACALECGKDWFEAAINSKRSGRLGFEQGFVAFFERDAHTHSFKSRCDWFEKEYDQPFEFFEQYIDLMVNEALPSLREPHWVPAWISTGSGPLAKSLTLCPLSETFTLAVPALLKHKEYTNFNRVYLLERMSSGSVSDIWQLMAKTTSFDTGDFTMLEQPGRLLSHQVIR